MYPILIQCDDQALARRVVDSLYARDVGGMEGIEVQVSGGVAVIRGQLPSSQAKRLCLECCRHVAGVMRVVDRLHVDLPIAGRDLGIAPAGVTAGCEAESPTVRRGAQLTSRV